VVALLPKTLLVYSLWTYPDDGGPQQQALLIGLVQGGARGTNRDHNVFSYMEPIISGGGLLFMLLVTPVI
jgi:hypothetical protein